MKGVRTASSDGHSTGRTARSQVPNYSCHFGFHSTRTLLSCPRIRRAAWLAVATRAVRLALDRRTTLHDTCCRPWTRWRTTTCCSSATKERSDAGVPIKITPRKDATMREQALAWGFDFSYQEMADVLIELFSAEYDFTITRQAVADYLRNATVYSRAAARFRLCVDAHVLRPV